MIVLKILTGLTILSANDPNAILSGKFDRTEIIESRLNNQHFY